MCDLWSAKISEPARTYRLTKDAIHGVKSNDQDSKSNDLPVKTEMGIVMAIHGLKYRSNLWCDGAFILTLYPTKVSAK